MNYRNPDDSPIFGKEFGSGNPRRALLGGAGKLCMPTAELGGAARPAEQFR